MEIFSYLIIFFCVVSKVNTKEEKNIFEVNKNLRFCGADLMEQEIQLFPETINRSSTRHLTAKKFSPIRIYLESTYFDSQGEDFANFPNLNDIIPLYKKALSIALKGLTSLVKVEEETGNIFSQIGPTLFLTNKVYKWNSIFENGSHLNSDFLLIVKLDNTNQLPAGIIAGASAIRLHPVTHRPIAGLLTISSKPQDTNYGGLIEYYSQVFLHELTHALGFGYSLFKYYPGGLNKTIAQQTIRGVKRNLIITPKVVEVAKKYFNCSNITGVELEDQGRYGTKNSHWEQRILLGDYMGGVIYQEDMAISEITLALLEDSQWYEVNYYTGGLMRFGKNKGCNFLYNLCINSNYETEFDNEFFDYKNQFLPSCSAGRESRTYSLLWKYDSIEDPNYNYTFIFENNSYYSSSLYTTDFCPIHFQDISESNNTYFLGNCQYGMGNYGNNIFYFNYETNKKESCHPNSQLPKELGEKYSNTSFCIMSSLAPIGVNKMYSSVFHPMCYQVHCSSSSLTIQINDDYIVCPRQGGNVELKGYDGKLHCPDYNLICTGTVICNSIFDCIEKKSLPKNDTFDYNYQSLTTQRYQNIPKVETFIGYELSNDGVCPIYCSQCSKNKKCKKCMNGYILVGINENDNNIICVNKKNVERGYYKNEDDIYYSCSQECETCKEKNNKCMECKENYYFLENTTSCYNKDNYPNGLYFNKEKNIFMACHVNCKTCSEGPNISDNKMNCDTCKENYKYDKKLKNCNFNEKSEIFILIYISLVISLIIAIIVAFIHIWYKKRQNYNDLLETVISD